MCVCVQSQPSVLGQGAQEFKGQDAKLSIIVGAMAVADLVKSTLGPKGMDKILQSQSGDITVTNDGATILRKLTLDNPAAKILVDISKTQDEEVGDGTTTVCILAGALLEQADPLLSQRLHPQTIIEGWRLALQVQRVCGVLTGLCTGVWKQPGPRILASVDRQGPPGRTRR